MPVEQKKSKGNAKSQSAEPWEVEEVHAELPTHSYGEVTEAVSDCKRGGKAKKRSEIVDCVRRKFS